MNPIGLSRDISSKYVQSRNDPTIKFMYTLSKGDVILPFKTLYELTKYCKKHMKFDIVNKEKTALNGLVYLYCVNGEIVNLSVGEFLTFRTIEGINERGRDSDSDNDSDSEKQKYKKRQKEEEEYAERFPKNRRWDDY